MMLSSLRRPSPRHCAAALCVGLLIVASAGCVRVRIHGDPDSALANMAQQAQDAIAASLPLRVATYNTSLYDEADGGLIRRLEAGDPAARNIAAGLQRVRPDVVLLNEFDYDAAGRAADLFQRYYL